MNTLTQRTITAAAIVFSAMLATQAAGQAVDEPAPLAEEGKWEMFVAGTYIHQFETAPDNADDFDVNRFAAGLGLRTRFSPDLTMSLRFSYALDMYDFGGGSNPFGGIPGRDPWDDINTFTSAIVFAFDATDEINIFGGAIGQSARESGAGWDHSWAGGGLVGGSYAFNPNLRLGAGVEFFDELGDDWKYILIPVVEWKINDEWRVSTSSSSRASQLGVALTGIELIYTLSEHWEFALGFAQNYARFRLDDTGPATGGIGEDESYPLWLRAVWNISEQFQLDGVFGFMIDGELKLFNSAGAEVRSTGYDPAPFVGIFGSVRF